MLLNRDYLYLPIINSPKYVVFSDFDETYLAHQMDDMQRQNLQELEVLVGSRAVVQILYFQRLKSIS